MSDHSTQGIKKCDFKATNITATQHKVAHLGVGPDGFASCILVYEESSGDADTGFRSMYFVVGRFDERNPSVGITWGPETSLGIKGRPCSLVHKPASDGSPSSEGVSTLYYAYSGANGADIGCVQLSGSRTSSNELQIRAGASVKVPIKPYHYFANNAYHTSCPSVLYGKLGINGDDKFHAFNVNQSHVLEYFWSVDGQSGWNGPHSLPAAASWDVAAQVIYPAIALNYEKKPAPERRGFALLVFSSHNDEMELLSYIFDGDNLWNPGGNRLEGKGYGQAVVTLPKDTVEIPPDATGVRNPDNSQKESWHTAYAYYASADEARIVYLQKYVYPFSRFPW